MNTLQLAPDLAAVYRRVSTDRQDDSLVLQETRVADYATYKKLTVREGLTFSDPDVSGRTPFMERSGGRALINRLRQGDVKHVVVAKLDRIGRNVRDAIGVLEWFQANQITLHITDFGGDTITTQNHMGKMILTIMLAMAEWEASEIRDRTTKIMRAKFDRRELTGNVPFGFDGEYTFFDGHILMSVKALSGVELAEAMATHGKVVSKLLVENEAEQSIIRQLADWRNTRVDKGNGILGAPSYQQVAAWANEAGYRTKQGGTWTCGNVHSVLTNRHTQRLLHPAEPAGVQASEPPQDSQDHVELSPVCP